MRAPSIKMALDKDGQNGSAHLFGERQLVEGTLGSVVVLRENERRSRTWVRDTARHLLPSDCPAADAVRVHEIEPCRHVGALEDLRSFFGELGVRMRVANHRVSVTIGELNLKQQLGHFIVTSTLAW